MTTVLLVDRRRPQCIRNDLPAIPGDRDTSVRVVAIGVVQPDSQRLQIFRKRVVLPVRGWAFRPVSQQLPHRRHQPSLVPHCRGRRTARDSTVLVRIRVHVGQPVLELVVEAHVVHPLERLVVVSAQPHGPTTPSTHQIVTVTRHRQIIAGQRALVSSITSARRLRRPQGARRLPRDRYPIFAITCPFHGNAGWRWIRDHDPDGWADAIAFDRAIRDGYPHATNRGQQLRGQYFLHRSCQPLDQVDLEPPTVARRRLRLATPAADEDDPDGCSPWSCRSGTAVQECGELAA